jgi:hypothetical protein
MTPRNTRTGSVLEQMVLPAVAQGGDKIEILTLESFVARANAGRL